MSQALIWTGTTWRLYGVANRAAVPNQVIFYESTDLKSWSAPTAVSFDPELNSDQRLWHIDVQISKGEYIGGRPHHPGRRSTRQSLPVAFC